MKTALRILAAAATVAAAVGVVAPTQPASARPLGNIVINKDQPYEKQQPAVTGSNPSSEANDPDAITCSAGAGGQGNPACDAGRFFIIRTGIAEEEDYFVTVRIEWTDPAGIDDFDLYVYKEPDHGPNEVPVAKSAGSTATQTGPVYFEQVKMFRAKDPHQIVVNHYAGVNTTGYKLKARIDVVKAEIVNESLDPDAPKRNDDEDEDEPFIDDTEPPSEEEPTFDFEGTFGDLPEDLGEGVDFTTPGVNLGLDGFGDLPTRVSDPGGAEGFFNPSDVGGQTKIAEVKPASGAQLAVWLGLVPVVFLAGMSGLLIKRRPAALSV